LERNAQPLMGGLSVINQLRPIEAQYNGLGDMPEGARVVSFAAEEVQNILPHTVTSHRGKLRPEDEERYPGLQCSRGTDASDSRRAATRSKGERMTLSLDHRQRFNLIALIGTQRGSVDEIRNFCRRPLRMNHAAER
jgi:hypothetical protein